jgi:hypothetical protein
MSLGKTGDNAVVVGMAEEGEKIVDEPDHHQESGKKEDVGYPASKGICGSHSP